MFHTISNSFIDDLVEDYNKVQMMILPEEPTIAQHLSVQLTKILVLTCASYYEQELQNTYIAYAELQADLFGDKPHGFALDKKDKSIYQKFEFGRIENSEDNKQLPDTKNMLKPLRSFGEKFFQKIYTEVEGNIEKERQLKAFQELFVIRNLLAHQTFVEFNSNMIRGKSFIDIKKLHEDAIQFVEYLKSQFSIN